MPLILNIESATDVCSVCISDGLQVLALEEATEPYRHSEKLTVLIQNCLSRTGLDLKKMDAIALSNGPGSYTSLRVGSSVAKGICYALGLPLIAVDTLKSLAFAAAAAYPNADFYCAMIDARRMEVYTSLFDARLSLLNLATALIVDANSFSEVLEKGEVVFCGNGAPKCKEIIRHSNAVFIPQICTASNLIAFSFEKFSKRDFTDFALYEPFYFKAPNITVPGKIL
ncbi:MAG TPA: tRNA (adenosine(37)-N6)-threonylcarbamoyltransferase complex dimerization subunit type 1 TsaB [Saprospiraceae bacterium]|nr:tRNA (adenosine(37)-N6)-threonylcarbamoyltransferase complex dimerization subunit type 1 TsaB [Saprospiraceae bacterium]